MHKSGDVGKKRKGKKRKVEPWDDISDDGDDVVGSDDESWVMHKPTVASLQQQQASDKLDSLPAVKQKQHRKAKRLPRDGMDAFASADDYMQDIETDLASVPADVALSEDADELRASKPRKQQKMQRTKGRRQ